MSVLHVWLQIGGKTQSTDNRIVQDIRNDKETLHTSKKALAKLLEVRPTDEDEGIYYVVSSGRVFADALNHEFDSDKLCSWIKCVSSWKTKNVLHTRCDARTNTVWDLL